MKITLPFLEETFNKFNKEIFDGQLSEPVFEPSRAKTFLGLCVRKPFTYQGKTQDIWILRFSIIIDLPKEQLEDIIIHEMIHYYIGSTGQQDSSAHGPLFLKIMDDINTRFGRHITVSGKLTKEQREQLIDKRRKWHVIAIVRFKDGREGFKVLPRVRESILRYKNTLQRSPEIDVVQLVWSQNVFFNRYPVSSAFRVHLSTNEELTPLLKDAKILQL
ncbi:MAG: SprT-like domain-containing protein [Prevotella sp.]|uniref:SprT-like domain-containing protein n=1 Tax=Prevotella sp. AGR2160 TaxID=1280674 RepID=UPI0003F7CB42|nr:SprT-like domain-containing protein [Prevotella sp. AGR2160]MDD5862461.1 SprT-like domain-containing protein [Prevotella sp.]